MIITEGTNKRYLKTTRNRKQSNSDNNDNNTHT